MKVIKINRSINLFFETTPIFNKKIIDVAFLGSFSGHYGWKETSFGDCDLWFFCDDITDKSTWDYIYNTLEALSKHLSLEYPELTIIYEVAYGPYKPEIAKLDYEVLFLHITVDDKKSYREHSDFTKLSWSKYECYKKKHMLNDLRAYYEPLSLDLQTAKYGIEEGFSRLREGSLDIIKYDFNENKMRTFSYKLGNYVFSEYMLYISMTNARNFFRALGFESADILQNEEFVEEFCCYLNSDSLKRIYHIKKNVEKHGYEIISPKKLYDVTYSFMEELSIAWGKSSVC